MVNNSKSYNIKNAFKMVQKKDLNLDFSLP